jgi:CRISPR-associated protein Cmr1
MEKLIVKLKTVTPLFLGGADPNVAAELRAPSIKGALRFWYRAIDPEFRQHENAIFGSTATGQSSFMLRVKTTLSNSEIKQWNKKDYTNKENEKKGVVYLGFSLDMRPNMKWYIVANKEIILEFLLPKKASDRCRKALLASVWLLGHFGGLGSRSRRGFGTVAIVSISNNTCNTWPEISEIMPAKKLTTIQEYAQYMEKSVGQLKQWFQGTMPNGHTAIRSGCRIYLFNADYDAKNNHAGWEHALNGAGLTMQEFRSRRVPDYADVKNHLAMRELVIRKKEDIQEVKNEINSQPLPAGESKPDFSGLNGVAPAWLKKHPERIAFGLPLTFQYSSLKKAKFKSQAITFQGFEHDRSASSVFIRIVALGEKYYPLFAILDAPLLPANEKIKDAKDMTGKNNLTFQPSKIIDDFCDDLETKSIPFGVK